MTLLPRKRHLALAVLAIAPVLAVPAPALAQPQAAAAADGVHQATAFFTKGVELFKAKKYAQALEVFKQSYALLASPNTHLYIARCLAATGDRRGAWLEYDRTAAEARTAGPKYEKVPDVAIQERDDLNPKPALVTVTVQNQDPAMTVMVGTVPVPPDRWGKPYPMDPGTYDVVVQAPGKPPVKQSITVAAGEQREATLDAAAGGPVTAPVDQGATASNGTSPLRIGAYVALGVGVVGFIMLGAEGSASKSTFNDISTLCGGKAGCPGVSATTRAEVNSKISSGTTQQAVANAGLAIGIIGVATGATLFVLSLRKKPSDDARPSANLVVKPSWAGVEGRF
jgi:hypothetical protein